MNWLPLSVSTVALLSLLAISAGCSAYQMGASAKPSVASLYIAPVTNQTNAADVSTPLHNAIREALIARGGIRPEGGEEKAAASLHVTLEHFQRSVAASDPRDTALGDSFRLILSGRASLVRPDSHFIFRDRPFHAECAIVVREDLIQAESQAIPVLARDFAEKVVRAFQGTW